jgi:hypothetical protein
MAVSGQLVDPEIRPFVLAGSYLFQEIHANNDLAHTISRKNVCKLGWASEGLSDK